MMQGGFDPNALVTTEGAEMKMPWRLPAISLALAAATVSGHAFAAPADEKGQTMTDDRKPSSRIGLLAPEDMTPEQREAYEKSPSAKLNLSRLLAQAKTLQPGMGMLIRAMMTDTTLPPLEREIVILAVLHLDRGAYEWAQHEQVADAMGISKAKVDAIADDRFGDPLFNEREKALLAFTRQTVKAVRVDDYAFGAVKAFYDDRQIVELIHLIGIYMLILRVSEIAELEIDAVHGAEVWKHAETAKE